MGVFLDVQRVCKLLSFSKSEYPIRKYKYRGMNNAGLEFRAGQHLLQMRRILKTAVSHHPKTVFISYSSHDREDAFKIKQLFESNQIKVWLDFFDIQTTAKLRQELSNRVRQSELFCLLLSPSAVQSPWVAEEIETALSMTTEGLRILPIILRPCSIPSQLENIVGFDASAGLEHEAVRLRLIRAVCGNAAVKESILLNAANRLCWPTRKRSHAQNWSCPALQKISRLSPAHPFEKST